MDKISPESDESCISTTSTSASNHLSNLLKYMNLNFEENPDSSSRQEELLECRIPPQEQVRNKILPTYLPLSGIEKFETQNSHLEEKSLEEMGYRANEVDGWENIIQPRKENLYKLLKNMIEKHIKPNVQIRIGDFSFNCHMIVLQCYSEFFMECGMEILIQLPEEKVTSTAFMMIYNWMTSSQPLIQREGILELLNAANFLRIKDLVNQIWTCLDNDVCFREDAAFLLYLEASKHGLEDVEQLMVMRISKFFLTMVASKDFLTLSIKQICSLLSSNTIGVNSEIEIFMSAVRWLNHKWPKRKCHILDVVKCVRFSLIPPWFLVTLNKDTGCIEVDRIIEHLEVKKMITDGITYTNLELYYSENRQEYLRLLEHFQLIVPMQRIWLYDKECKYQYRLEYSNMQSISYGSFLEYLEMISSIGKDYWRSIEMDKGVDESKMIDCNKSNQPNPGMLCSKRSRDQGVQCAIGFKNPKNKEYKVNVINSIRRSPRAQPRFVPSQVPLANNFVYRETKAEAEKTMNLNYAPETGIDINVRKLEKKEEHQRNKTLYDDKNYQQKRQQLPTEITEQEQLADTQLTHYKFFNNTDIDVQLNRQQQKHQTEMSKSYKMKKQQQQEKKHEQHRPKEQKHKENEFHNERPFTGSCSTEIHKHAVGSMIGGGGSEQQQLQLERQSFKAGDTFNTEFLKHNVNLVLERPVGDCCTRNDDLLESKVKKSTTIFFDDSTRISIRKILVFGGIDPYSSQSQHLQELQQLKEDKTSQKQQKQQKYNLHPNKEQELIQRKRVHSIDSIIMNTTNLQMETIGDAQTCAVGAVANTNLKNFGDHVLYCDVDVMEWRYLSHIPFSSRHHHGVVACNGLIYVIGGTRTALGSSKKSVFEKSIWCFNPQTIKWTLETNLPEARRDFGVIAIDNKSKLYGNIKNHDVGFYIIGGEGVNGRALSTVWFYTLKRKIWVKKPSLNMGRYGLAAAMINNEVWVAGGIISENINTANARTACTITDTIEVYNLKYTNCNFVNLGEGDTMIDTSGICYKEKHMKHKLGEAAANRNCSEDQWVVSKIRLRIPRLFGKFCKMLNGQLYVVGGIAYNNQHKELTSLTDIDVFNEEQQKWKHIGDLHFARHGHDVAILNDYCFAVVGGISTVENCSLSEVEVFCTTTHQCLKNLPHLPWPLAGCAAVAIK